MSACYRAHELRHGVVGRGRMTVIETAAPSDTRDASAGPGGEAAARGARAQDAFPDHRRHDRAPPYRRRQGGRRRRSDDRARRDAGAGRRERLRQDDDGALHPAPRKADRRPDHLRRRRYREARPARPGGAAAAHPGHLPGPVQLAEPAHEDRLDHRRADAGARRRAGSRAAAATGSPSCCRSAASIRISPTAIRTRCRAGSGSASGSRGRWR